MLKNKKQKNTSDNVVLIDDVLSIQAEALQKLQINIDFASIDDKVKVVSITSGRQGEGKSTTIANLAHLYALKGSKVLLIDLDLRRPTVHYFFNLPNEQGITDFCSDKITEEELINNVIPGLDVIVRGEATPFPIKVLESKKLADLISKYKDIYDYILIDTPPVLVVADTLYSSKYTDGYLFVAEYKKSKKSDVKESLKVLKDSNVNVLGVVVTRVSSVKDGYYRYYTEGNN